MLARLLRLLKVCFNELLKVHVIGRCIMANTKRYYSTAANRSSSSLRNAILFSALGLIIVALSGVAFVQHNNANHLKSTLNNLREKLQVNQNELSVLRTINPYQYQFEHIIPHAVNAGEVFPGWVTRVFPAPRKKGDLLRVMDMGAFILDQNSFNLNVHKHYGLDTPENVLYQMNGLLPSKKEGRYQIGIEFLFSPSLSVQQKQSFKMQNCYAQLEVNNKRVIDSQIRFVINRATEKLITGDVMVGIGVHPIMANIYCDEDTDFDMSAVEISMIFREPGDVVLQRKRNSVFHIYKPGKV